MALVLRNKQLLALIVVALITVAVISFLVLGMTTHFGFLHQTTFTCPC